MASGHAIVWKRPESWGYHTVHPAQLLDLLAMLSAALRTRTLRDLLSAGAIEVQLLQDLSLQ